MTGPEVPQYPSGGDPEGDRVFQSDVAGAGDAPAAGSAPDSDPLPVRFAGDGKDPEAFRTIGEVAQALSIRPHVLRYWEEQFPMLRPVKRSGGRRYYRPEDVRLVETIDRLVHREGYTLRGARKVLEQRRRNPAKTEPLPAIEALDGAPLADADTGAVASPPETAPSAVPGPDMPPAGGRNGVSSELPLFTRESPVSAVSLVPGAEATGQSGLATQALAERLQAIRQTLQRALDAS